jgi:hypothetical protein
MAAYDKLDWHYDAAVEAGQPGENGFTHIGIYLAWLIRHDLHDPDSFPADHVEAIKRGKMTGSNAVRIRLTCSSSRLIQPPLQWAQTSPATKAEAVKGPRRLRILPVGSMWAGPMSSFSAPRCSRSHRGRICSRDRGSDPAGHIQQYGAGSVMPYPRRTPRARS